MHAYPYPYHMYIKNLKLKRKGNPKPFPIHQNLQKKVMASSRNGIVAKTVQLCSPFTCNPKRSPTCLHPSSAKEKEKHHNLQNSTRQSHSTLLCSAGTLSLTLLCHSNLQHLTQVLQILSSLGVLLQDILNNLPLHGSHLERLRHQECHRRSLNMMA